MGQQGNHYQSVPASAADITAAVRQFYETFPFPGRMKTMLDATGWRAAALGFAARHTLFGEANVQRIRSIFVRMHSSPTTILDAGCGSGELACLLALAFPEATVTGADLAELNLSYANKLRGFLGLDNIRFVPANLMDPEGVAALPRADLVVCSGALHHLADPTEGLRLLAGRLTEDGRLHFGVYGAGFAREAYLREALAPFGRWLDQQGRYRFLRDLGIDRQALIRVQKRERPVLKVLRDALRLDFSYLGYQMFPHADASVQMDGFFHPHVNYFGIDSLLDMIEAAGLELVSIAEPPAHWKNNPIYAAMPLRARLRLLDACDQIPYAPVCRRAVREDHGGS